MTMGRRVGVLFRSQWPAERLPGFAAGAERDGFDELWVAEDCFEAGGMTMAAVALAGTSRLRVGVGLLPTAVRNPAIAAMEIAALARLYPGRFSAAFGHGVDAWMRQIDARPADRLVVLEEVVGAVRRLLAGEALTVDGRAVRLDAVRLDHPPDPPPPVLVGTTGARGLEIAGRVSDGIVLPEGAGAAAVEWARGAAGGGETTVYAWLSLEDSADAAVAAIRPDVEHWARGGIYPVLTELAGLGRDGTGELSDDVVRSVAVAGDAAGCASAIEALWAAGADSVVLLVRLDDSAEQQLARFAAEVRPLLQSSQRGP